ncbi:Glycosyltransferase family protein [Pyrodictium delaneyi]|uniref:Glycosyltransferase family protein n=1 Tax=Pyrodictium delaneyi TaxID=1273541 RepID=A0A0P0N6M4_9CREN|nr:glycosyltransferase family A protein [Pyrodictium delaneyi]ALL01987.1 Glycosyltransferase family protein [Pyrodictium delaneyi]OWJ54846.1 hypothetical protein Pdsh_03795 [Pyrodictium delaneyi]
MNLLIIVPAKNEEKFLPYALKSIVRNVNKLKYDINVTVIVVDDASTDRTPEIIRQFSHKYKFIKHVRINVTREYDSSIGLVRAIRAGLIYAEKVLNINWNYFMQVDADTVLLSNYIDKLLSVMTAYDHIGIAGGVSINAHQSNLHIHNTGMIIRKEAWTACRGYKPLPSPDTIIQLCVLSKGWKVAIVKQAKMYFLRPVRLNPYKVGLADKITGVSFPYSIIKSTRLSISNRSFSCIKDYFAGYISARRINIECRDRITRYRRIIEKLRIKEMLHRYIAHVNI